MEGTGLDNSSAEDVSVNGQGLHDLGSQAPKDNYIRASTIEGVSEHALPQRQRHRSGKDQPDSALDKAPQEHKEEPLAALPGVASLPGAGAAEAMVALALRPRAPCSHATTDASGPVPAVSSPVKRAEKTNRDNRRSVRVPSGSSTASSGPGPTSNAPAAADSSAPEVVAAATAAAASALAVDNAAPRSNASAGDPEALAAAASAAAAAAALGSFKLATAVAAIPKPPPRIRAVQPTSSAANDQRSPTVLPPRKTPASTPTPGARLSGRQPPAAGPVDSKRRGRGSSNPGPAAAEGDAAAAASASSFVPLSVHQALLADHSKLSADRALLACEVRRLATQIRDLSAQHSMLQGELQRLLSQDSNLTSDLASQVTQCESQAELEDIVSDAVRQIVLVDEHQDAVQSPPASAVAEVKELQVGGKDEVERGEQEAVEKGTAAVEALPAAVKAPEAAGGEEAKAPEGEGAEAVVAAQQEE